MSRPCPLRGGRRSAERAWPTHVGFLQKMPALLSEVNRSHQPSAISQLTADGSMLFPEQGQVLPVALRFQLRNRNEAQGGGVHAIAHPRRTGPVGEQVTEVRIGVLGPDFG